MSRPTAISPEEQEQIARKIGVLLLQSAPEDWQQITVEYRATGEYHDLLAEVTAQDGTSRPWEAPEDLVGIFEHLREGMYRSDVGTWLSALYVVERPSSYRIDINFDAEPQWHRPLPRAAYVDELRRYPRAEENVPDWMREYLTGSGSAPEAAHADPAPSEPAPPSPAPAEPAQPETARFDPGNTDPGYGGTYGDGPAYGAPAHEDTGYDDAGYDDTGHEDTGHESIGHGDAGYEDRARQEQFHPATAAAVAPDPVDAAEAATTAEIPGTVPPAHSADPAFRTAMVFDDFDDHGRPVVATRTPVRADEAAALRQYLESAPIVLASRDNELDQLDTEQAASVPATWHTDGFWLWPGAVAFYLAQYGVPPEHELVEHIRGRRFALDEVDERTREAAVSELLDQPAEHLEESPVDIAPPREPAGEPSAPEQDFASADPGPMPTGPAPALAQDDEIAGDARPPEDGMSAELAADAPPEPAAEEPAAEVGPRHVMPEEPSAPADSAPETALALLHDRLTDLGVDSSRYRIGSHSTSARCLVQEGPDWVVTADDEGGADLRFARPDQAAAYLLGSLLLSGHGDANVPARQERESEMSEPPPGTFGAVDAETGHAVPEEPGSEASIPAEPRPTLAGDPEAPGRTEIPDQPAPEPYAATAESPTTHEEPAGQAGLGDLPRRTPGSRRHGEPETPAQYPEQVSGHFLFTANQTPPTESQEPAQPAGEEPTRFQPMPRLDRPAPPAGPHSPPGGQPAPGPRPAEPGRNQTPPAPGQAPPPLPKRPERGSTGMPPQDPSGRPPAQPGPGQPGPGGERRAAPGMAGPPRQPGAPPAGQRPPQGGSAAGQTPVGRDQQIQPLRGEPPLTLYRDRRHLVLQPGTDLDRFGDPAGNVAYAMRTPYSQRSLPPQWASRPYFAYRVQRPLQVLRGTAVPWFEQPGGGTAYVLPAAVQDLVADGTLAELPGGDNARPPME